MIVPFDLSESESVLVPGAGGGFDFLCGLPIVLELEDKGHIVHVANYSFTNLHDVLNAEWMNENLLKITTDSQLQQGDYFPERLLSWWFRQFKQVEKPIWCFTRSGVRPTLESYEFLVKNLNIDAVICVDGGVDGIFRGDEWDLGTPSMDSISIISTSMCRAKRKIYACTAFGTEGSEGQVSHAQALNRMADLLQQDAMLGVGMILRRSSAGSEFLKAVNVIYQHLPPLRQSIIVSSIRAAVNGAYGRTVVHEKTRDHPPWISPLTSLIWYFNAENVAKMKLFYEASLVSSTVPEMGDALQTARDQVSVKEYESIPI
jgi:hypothetical protein